MPPGPGSLMSVATLNLHPADLIIKRFGMSCELSVTPFLAKISCLFLKVITNVFSASGYKKVHQPNANYLATP